jgi:NAD(P)H dehydrogenase (quinone)
MRRYAIAGVRGKVGGAAARALLDAGHAVRAVLRDKKKAAKWE